MLEHLRGVGTEKIIVGNTPITGLETRSDQELISALNAGESSAFEALYRRHREWVVSLAFRLTQDHALALDVLQETFLYLLKKFPGFVLTAHLQTFFYPVVRNLSIAARRKAHRVQGDDMLLDNVEAPAQTPSATDHRDQLSIVLAGLSEDQREVLLLRFVDDLDLAEIGVALGIPLGTVKSRLHNALKLLRADPRTKELFEE